MTVSTALADVLHKLIDHVPWREEADKTQAHQVLSDETETAPAAETTPAEGVENE